MSYNVLYSDTDSVFFELTADNFEERIKELQQICQKLNKAYDKFCKQYNCEENEYLKIEPEKIFGRWLQGGRKKRYAGVLDWEEGMDMREEPYEERFHVRGFEIRRSNTAVITTEVQKRVLKIILLGGGEEEVMNYLDELRDGFFEGKYDIKTGIEAVVKPMKVYKDPDSQAHVRAWKWANAHGYDIEIREPFLWWWCEDGDTKAIPINEDELHEEIDIDYDRMFERNVIKKIKPIMNAIIVGEFNMNTFLDGKVQQSNEEFIDEDMQQSPEEFMMS